MLRAGPAMLRAAMLRAAMLFDCNEPNFLVQALILQRKLRAALLEPSDLFRLVALGETL